ncbi:MAG: DNA-binding protein [Desulfurococcaceae archaeon]|nr:DNA-binding protein [Desulfurococcaceae archaeon]
MSYYEDASELSDEELEMIKRRKLEEIYRRGEAEKLEREKRLREEAIKREMLRRILTPEARERLSNLRLVKPELVEALENQLITLAQSGRVKIPITDEELKEILAQISERTRRDFKITIKEK